jgi:hypothetical protein
MHAGALDSADGRCYDVGSGEKPTAATAAAAVRCVEVARSDVQG